jgi:hypothetical protein
MEESNEFAESREEITDQSFDNNNHNNNDNEALDSERKYNNAEESTEINEITNSYSDEANAELNNHGDLPFSPSMQPNSSPSYIPQSLSLTPEQQLIQSEFAELMAQNELLAKENRLFDSFLQRNSVALLALQQEQAAAANLAQKGSQRKAAKFLLNSELVLSDADRGKIGLEELDYRNKQLSALESKSKEDITLLKSITEGIRIRINEMRKETYEFQRDIVLGAENDRTGEILAERVVRYFEEKLRQKQNLIDKIKLKNRSLRAHRVKLELQVKHKEEQGDSLHSIDFHQLQIKNSQFNQKIKERNAELLKLKLTTGRTVAILNETKKNLNNFVGETKNLKKEIKEKEALKVKLQGELSRVQEELRLEMSRNKKYKIQQSNPEMPQVLDYVQQKSLMYELEAAEKNWQRKVEIIEMSAKRARMIVGKYNKQESPYQQQESKTQTYNNKNNPRSIFPSI